MRRKNTILEKFCLNLEEEMTDEMPDAELRTELNAVNKEIDDIKDIHEEALKVNKDIRRRLSKLEE